MALAAPADGNAGRATVNVFLNYSSSICNYLDLTSPHELLKFMTFHDPPTTVGNPWLGSSLFLLGSGKIIPRCVTTMYGLLFPLLPKQ